MSWTLNELLFESTTVLYIGPQTQSRYFIISFFLRTDFSFCSLVIHFSSIVIKRPDLTAHEILGQNKEKDHVVESKWDFISILNVSFLIFHSGRGTEEAVFPVPESFLF